MRLLMGISLVVVLAVSVLGFGPGSPAESEAAAGADADGWYDWTIPDQPAPKPTFLLVVTGAASVTVVDGYCAGDMYSVRINGKFWAETSHTPRLDCTVRQDSPDLALASPTHSRATISLTRGRYEIAIWANNPREAVGAGFIRFDGDFMTPPYWQVRAKVGGGNVFNGTLPDYVPETWSGKNVTLYLSCSPGSSPISSIRGDLAVTFKEGQHVYSTGDGDRCTDENGLTALPVAYWGPIWVDTTPPKCVVNPSNVFVPRGSSAYLDLSLTITDATSPVSSTSRVDVLGGARVWQAYLFGGPAPDRMPHIEVTMPNSTAGRIDWNFRFTDKAGNSTTCKIVIHAR